MRDSSGRIDGRVIMVISRAGHDTAGQGIRKKLIDLMHKWRHRIMVNKIR